MLTPQDRAQIFRELADTAEAQAMHLTNADAAWKMANLATRARQAAEEIEGRREPTDEELQALWIDGNWFNEGATPREFASITRLVLARFGGGEGEQRLCEKARRIRAIGAEQCCDPAEEKLEKRRNQPAQQCSPYSFLYLMAQRKCWHHDVPSGWEETHWERFDYVECGIYRKPTADLDDVDRRWLSDYGCRPEGWIEPSEVG